jgi:DNA primase
VLLVEGEADVIAARSHGLAAIALPGVHSWRPQRTPLFAGRRVVITMDADVPEREVARRIAYDLARQAAATILDLAPQRSDGYDLTDWLCQHGPMGDQR